MYVFVLFMLELITFCNEIYDFNILTLYYFFQHLFICLFVCLFQLYAAFFFFFIEHQFRYGHNKLLIKMKGVNIFLFLEEFWNSTRVKNWWLLDEL